MQAIYAEVHWLSLLVQIHFTVCIVVAWRYAHFPRKSDVSDQEYFLNLLSCRTVCVYSYCILQNEERVTHYYSIKPLPLIRCVSHFLSILLMNCWGSMAPVTKEEQQHDFVEATTTPWSTEEEECINKTYTPAQCSFCKRRLTNSLINEIDQNKKKRERELIGGGGWWRMDDRDIEDK